MPDAKEMEAAISSTALVTVQAYRNIAEDPVKRGPLINVRLSLKTTFVSFGMLHILFYACLFRMKRAYSFWHMPLERKIQKSFSSLWKHFNSFLTHQDIDKS